MRANSFFDYIIYGLCALVLVVAVFGVYMTPHEPSAIDLANKFAPTSASNLLGTDHLGRDIFSRILAGARVSVLSTLASIVLIVLLGTAVGFVAGFGGARIDNALMRICDVFMCFPTIVLALFFVGVLGTGLANVIIAIALTHWAWYARIIRSIVLGLRHSEYVLASRVCGAGYWWILSRHFARPIFTQLAVLASLDLGHIMLHISGLSLLGLGVRAPSSEWGIMIAESKEYILSHYELVLYPGCAMMFVIVVFNILGDRLRDRFDSIQERCHE